VDGLRLGVFGGTFDPPHLGHLILAEAARDQLRLDRVLWVVAGQSPLKLDRQLSPAETRAAMVQAAIADNPTFALSRVDLDRPGPHYTADTLALLGAEFPGAALFFVMGEDSLRDLPRWWSPQEIMARAWLAVAQRPGNGTAELADLEARLPGVGARVLWVQAPKLEIASSDIQRRIRAGQTTRYMLPNEVLRVIESNGLYGSGNG